jgi:enoyl-CoA hydratase/carnithine racemase
MPAELLASRRDHTLVLTLSDTATMNSLHPDMYAAAVETLETAERDDSLRAIVLTGARNAFCAGANLNRLLENRAKDRSVQADEIDRLHDWIAAIRDCSKPVIAAVEGTAAGAGFSLALACDLIVAAQSARFSMSTVKLGLPPEGGASWLLSHTLPRQLATEILLDGEALSSERLYQAGLVNRVVADGSALDAALAWGERIADQSPQACMHIKALLRDAPSNNLQQQFDDEKQRFVDSLHHREGLEGISAFIEKRKAHYP